MRHFIGFIVLVLFSIPGLGKECVSFYHVYRPLAGPLLFHEYVVGKTDRSLEVFGLPKAGSDLDFVEDHFDPEDKETFVYLGSACEREATATLQIARKTSKQWQNRYRAWLPYLSRMALTPLLGKPCRKAALAVGEQLNPYLID